MRPSEIVWRAHGAPRVESCEEHDGRCWLCSGALVRGEPVESWAGNSFTSQNRVLYPAGTHVCEACCFVCSRVSPVLGRPPKEGKTLGGNFRNYSHLADALGYANASKGEKSAIREFLARDHRSPWFAAIADSGQKHVIPFTPMNGPGRAGSVLFDEQLVIVPDEQSLVAEMMGLLTAGATKEELGSGDYGARAWQLCGELLAQFEARRGADRHGGWFSLALWLAQRDEEAVAARVAAEKEAKGARRKGKGTTAHADGRGSARGAKRVPRDAGREHAEALGTAPESDARSGPDNGDSGGMGNVALPEPAAADAAQLQLFGAR